MKDVSGKVAVITGGTSGIGLGIARSLAAAGAKTVITYRRRETVPAAIESLRSVTTQCVRAIHMDVTSREQVSTAAAEIDRMFGKVHILCNSAGVSQFGPMDQATYDDWDWILNVNLGGIVNTLINFLPLMKAHGEGGHVVNVASMSAFIVGAASGVYATSKFAVRGLTEALQLSLAPHRIGVSMLCPGLTKSRIYEAVLHRPPHLASTAFPVQSEAIERMAQIHTAGMQADEVGRKALEGILSNNLFIFSHPEFRDELWELAKDLDASFTDEVADPRRLEIEDGRRKAKALALQTVRRLKAASRGGC
jgi:NAD(P)-dependent dehydrogenase (short-subunit alcohol dehydrogenase family)